MSEDATGLADYLRVLSTLHASQLHAFRAQLGNLSLHAALASEILDRAAGMEPLARDRIAQALDRIEVDVERLLVSGQRWLGQIRMADDDETFDLRELFAELDSLVGPFLAERRLPWSTEPPPSPVPIRGDRSAAQRVTLMAVVERAERLPAGTPLSLRWGGDAAPAMLRLESAGSDGETSLIALAPLVETHAR